MIDYLSNWKTGCRQPNVNGGLAVLLISNDEALAITTAAATCWHNSEVHGFHDHTAGEHLERLGSVTRLALIMTECAEAIEELRAPTFDPEAYASELADIFIRLGDLAIETNVDLGAAVAKKHAKNIGRPVMHGGKKF
jgi:NTP pyrophosphatase (non-canonical NTP hydrolase)